MHAQAAVGGNTDGSQRATDRDALFRAAAWRTCSIRDTAEAHLAPAPLVMDSAFALGFSRDAVTLLPATRGLLRARRGAAPFVLGATVHNQTPFGLTVLGRARPPASVKPPALPVAAPTNSWFDGESIKAQEVIPQWTAEARGLTAHSARLLARGQLGRVRFTFVTWDTFPSLPEAVLR